MDPALSTRVESMFSRDRAMALAFVVVLWLTILFVYFAIAPMIASASLRVVLIIGAALLLLFNTASMIAMIRHYRQDKEHIYGLDIRHMDESK
jgi:nicotinamide riboside transporter PnuC